MSAVVMDMSDGFISMACDGKEQNDNGRTNLSPERRQLLRGR